MSGKNGNSVYERLTPQRKQIVDMILANLENGAGIWKRGWRCAGVPENAITGKDTAASITCTCFWWQ